MKIIVVLPNIIFLGHRPYCNLNIKPLKSHLPAYPSIFYEINISNTQ